MTTTTERAETPAEGPSSTAGHDLLADLREAIAAARIRAGRLLACLRHTAGISQAHLARRIGYSATVVAHAELGRRPVSAEFWELADDALGAGGKLTAQGVRIRDLATARREEQRRRDMARHARRTGHLLSRPYEEDDTVPAAPAAPALAVTTPATGRCPHCNQPVTLVTKIAAPPAPSRARDLSGRHDASRVLILGRLLAGPRSVGDITRALGMEQSADSDQSRVPREYKLVRAERAGRMRLYALSGEHLSLLLEAALRHAGPDCAVLWAGRPALAERAGEPRDTSFPVGARRPRLCPHAGGAAWPMVPPS
jgi:DNA-binding transcriptional ArsR family regulator/transcriptional regulator with XRE-family HTH domain